MEELSQLAAHQEWGSTRGRTASSSGSSSSSEEGGGRVVGMAANVARAADMAALADFAVEQLGGIDIWVNNAGRCRGSWTARWVGW